MRLTILAAVGVALQLVWSAVFASPYPQPQTAEQLACNLSRSANGADYRHWWDRVAREPVWQTLFWEQVVPNRAAQPCSAEVQRMFWLEAVPQNWSPRPDIGGWYLPHGGYYTQHLWLRAIPEGWAAMAPRSGWPFARGGYYAQTFWLEAVPDHWARIDALDGWPWRDGGYYTQWLWLHAVPRDWAAGSYPLRAGGEFG